MFEIQKHIALDIMPRKSQRPTVNTIELIWIRYWQVISVWSCIPGSWFRRFRYVVQCIGFSLLTALQNQPSYVVHLFYISDFSATCTRLKAHNSCKKILQCGHVCSGFKNETQCPPCLVKNCNSDVKQTRDDDCIICFTEELSAAPVIVVGTICNLNL